MTTDPTDWRSRYRESSLLSDHARMAEAFQQARQSDYGIFDRHYLSAGIHLKARDFAAAKREYRALSRIDIADKQELAEHRLIGQLMLMLIDKARGHEIDDTDLIQCLRLNPESNHRFLFGFVNGGYIGLDIVFPKFAQIVTNHGTSNYDVDLDRNSFKAQLLASFEQRQPYSFIRLNDGEGALLYLLAGLARDTLEFEHYLAIQKLWRGWFGQDFLDADTAIIKQISSAFNALIIEATVIGLDTHVIQHWHTSRGLESKVGCYISNLHTKTVRGNHGTVHSDILYTLQEEDRFLTRFLQQHGPFSIISCHPQVQDAMQQRGIDVADVIEVPAEQQFNATFNTRSQPGVHLEQVYPQVLSRIQGIDASQHYAWLIAAGPLGKIYAHELFKRGCFVLDLGAIMDGMLGFIRRPRLSVFADRP